MITTAQIHALEEKAVQQGTSIKELMANAAQAVHETITQKFETHNAHIILFAGHGNNGGDAFATAKLFAKEQEHQVIVLFFGWEEKLKGAALHYYNEIKDSVNIFHIESQEDLKQFKFQQKDLILIDGILGTGVKGKIRHPQSLGIDFFNSLNGIKVAIDIPSGMNPDTGEVEDKVCNADLIVCFHDLKTGLEKIKENVIVKDIGLPKN